MCFCLVKIFGLEVYHDQSIFEVFPELQPPLQSGRGDVRLGPAIPLLLHILFILDPAGDLLPLLNTETNKFVQINCLNG